MSRRSRQDHLEIVLLVHFFSLVLRSRVLGVFLFGSQVNGDLVLGSTGDSLLQAL